ncbi:MAG: matrixin family metalloprotease [Solirubrobacteraceae bacterium]|nr:matrixin family metalloprotease [Solirubrobacteraceae bacterium]
MTDFVLSGQRWDKPTVSWFYSGSAGFQADVARAFDRWDGVINLDFVQASSAAQADIAISFSAIDGPFNTLATSTRSWFGSAFMGDNTIKFDTAETWTFSQSAGSYLLSIGVSFFAVALLEIGHAIGLSHPTNSATLMFATASAAVRDLTSGDIAGGQAIYGAEATVTLPDFASPAAPTVSAATVAAGASFTLTYSVENRGAGSAGSSITGIYLSTDSAITTGDTLITIDAVNAITANGRTTETVSVTIPNGFAAGSYYLGVSANYGIKITEAFETNNASPGTAITVTAAPPTPGGLITALSLNGQLELIYCGYFNRAADGGGFNFWSDQNSVAQSAGQSVALALSNIANSFRPQPETLALYPALAITNPDFHSASTLSQLGSFIDVVYGNLFGRAPDAAGKAYWTGQIVSGAIDFGAAILAIANGATGNDRSIVLNKVQAALDFTTETASAGIGLAATLTPAFKTASVEVLNGVDATLASVIAAKAETIAVIATQASSVALQSVNGWPGQIDLYDQFDVAVTGVVPPTIDPTSSSFA